MSPLKRYSLTFHQSKSTPPPLPTQPAKPPKSIKENPDNFQGKTGGHLIYLYSMTAVALVDDHKIFSDSLAGLINDFEGFTVCWTAQDGIQAIEQLKEDGAMP
ncbi:MAG: hypothetical protein ABIN67_01565, partial [Ferruginibacter sp.]